MRRNTRYFGQITLQMAHRCSPAEAVADAFLRHHCTTQQNPLESYRATNSDDRNQTMRILTATSIILMGVTLIAGIYGLNFDPAASPLNMPELHARYGYPGALLAMAIVAGILAWLFRRKGYL